MDAIRTLLASTRWWHLYVLGMLVSLARSALTRYQSGAPLLESTAGNGTRIDLTYTVAITNAILWPINVLTHAACLLFGTTRIVRLQLRYLERIPGFPRTPLPLSQDELVQIARSTGLFPFTLADEDLDIAARFLATEPGTTTVPSCLLALRRPFTEFEVSELRKRIEAMESTSWSTMALALLPIDGGPVVSTATIEALASHPIESLMPSPPEVGERFHVCTSRNLACSGLNPCVSCYGAIMCNVILPNVVAAGVDPAIFERVVAESYRRFHTGLTNDKSFFAVKAIDVTELCPTSDPDVAGAPTTNGSSRTHSASEETQPTEHT